jgi:uncharacterized membrane protein
MRDSDRNNLAAALLGASSGMRTFTPAAVLVARGRLPVSAGGRKALLLAAAAELVGDKLPFAPARIKPGSYLGRIASGAYCGRALAGGSGTLPAAAASAAATFLGYQGRKAARRKLRSALLEDVLAITAANLAVIVAAD